MDEDEDEKINKHRPHIIMQTAMAYLQRSNPRYWRAANKSALSFNALN